MKKTNNRLLLLGIVVAALLLATFGLIYSQRMPTKKEITKVSCEKGNGIPGEVSIYCLDGK